ncbi:27 kDa antigen Cfp30B [Pseudoalteromonas luteoviolacea B = ATCC 29581]|nr:27 kDa antigen Cfp30B [Pseudoalteromonas luteoviolacea B = ATCC 29581]
MAIVKNSPPNTFCWAELCSSDWLKAKAFYLQLFQWTSIDQPIGADCYYTITRKESVDVAAMYQMMASQQAEGIPSHWLPYIAVENVDEKTTLASALGAEVIHGPHDVPGAGRMVMLQEPGGAIFALWQGKEHMGTQRKLEYNVPYWHELASRNAQKSRAFYSGLFGWEIQIKPMDNMDYTLFCIDDKPVAGLIEMTQEWGELPAHWMIYFAVANTNNVAQQATQLGGTVCVPPTDVPGVGCFSVITDPSGAVFSVLHSSAGDVEAR